MSRPVFEWDLSSVQERIDNQKEEDKFYSFRINLDSGYGWGLGMTEEDHDRYISQMRNELGNNKGYNIWGDASSMSSMELKNPAYYCYLHPMEWTGWGKQKFIYSLLDALKNMECVKEFELVKEERLLPITPHEYEKLIIKNTKNLIPFFESLKNEHSWEAGMLFAEDYRLPVILDYGRGVGLGYSSSDIDVMAVQTIYEAYEKMKELGIIDLSALKDKESDRDYDEPER